MAPAYAAGNPLKRWLGSQEPIDALFKKEIFVIRDFLTEEYVEKARGYLTQLYGDGILPLVDEMKTLTEPILLFTQAEHQQVTGRIFKLNNTVFAGGDISAAVNRASHVFPHIISAGSGLEDELEGTDPVRREVALELCRQANSAGFARLIDEITKGYPVTTIIPAYPGEPGWELLEGVRIFEIFSKETAEIGLFIDQTGNPNHPFTAFGLIIAS